MSHTRNHMETGRAGLQDRFWVIVALLVLVLLNSARCINDTVRQEYSFLHEPVNSFRACQSLEWKRTWPRLMFRDNGFREFSRIPEALLDAGWGLHSQSLRYMCGQKLDPHECQTLLTNRTYCFDQFRWEVSSVKECFIVLLLCILLTFVKLQG